MPATPSGRNGSKLPPSNAVNATTQKKIRMPSLTITMMLLVVADSLAPRSSRNMQAMTTKTAGRLKTPPASPGGLAMAAGSWMPNALRNSLRYWPQPTATADTDTPYSSIKHQPQTHAMISPSVA